MPIGFIPRMASKVGTAVCGTACTVVCEVAWGTNPHAPTRLARAHFAVMSIKFKILHCPLVLLYLSENQVDAKLEL